MQRLELRQNQSQKLTPQQIQFIKLLQLSNSNIDSEIKKELEENPALEENENNRSEELEISNSENYNYSQKRSNDLSDFSRESNISSIESFRESLLNQINYLKLDKNEIIIAKQIIGTLDNDGYLRRDLESIIDDIAFSENTEYSYDEIEKVLLKIQSLEPHGIGARNLEECLIIQIDSINELTNTQTLARKILEESFIDFKKKQFDKIYNKFDESKAEINNAFNFIKTLNPKPSGGLEGLEITEFLIPDFIIKKNNEEFIVELASGNRKININNKYISI